MEQSKIVTIEPVFILSDVLPSVAVVIAKAPKSRGGDSHIKQTGMLVGNFEFNP